MLFCPPSQRCSATTRDQATPNTTLEWDAHYSNHDRLVALKNKYDPTNLFRHNQNIKPTV